MHELQARDLPHYTYEDYILWEGKWEIICGLVYAMSPAPSIQHQKISSRIERILEEKLSNCERCFALLPVDWKITDDTIVQPDNEQYITKSPDIIFEVLSKSTAHKDRTTKFHLTSLIASLILSLLKFGTIDFLKSTRVTSSDSKLKNISLALK